MTNKTVFSPVFLLLAVLFCVCIIVANLMEIKTVELGPLTITAGFVVFPLSYIISDCIVEIYGFSRARFVIWLGFAMNLLVTLLLQLGLALPSHSTWHYQDAMQVVFGATPRIFAASFAAFLCGSMVNAYVMSRMKSRASKPSSTAGFSMRAIMSTLWGEGVDSAIFFPLAFAGILPWRVIFTLCITQALLKTLYEILVLPVTLRVVNVLRRYEGVSADSDNTPQSYKWWKISEI